MNPSVIVIFSAFLHASWNAIVKRSPDSELLLLRVMVISAFPAFIAILVYGAPNVSMGFLLWAITAGIFEAGYLYSLAKALSKDGLGVSYAIMRGGAMAIVWLIAISFFGQEINGFQLIGLVLIFGGLPFVHFKGGAKENAARRSSWSYLAAICIAGYHLCYGKALVLNNQPILLFSVALCFSVPIFVLSSRRKPSLIYRFENKIELGVATAGGFLCGASFLIFLFGLRDTGPGLGISLRNTSMVFAQGYAWFLGERPTVFQWFGIFLITMGALVLI